MNEIITLAFERPGPACALSIFVGCPLMVFIGLLVAAVLDLIRVIIQSLLPMNRFIRHLNVRKAGWPPAHLDADGDWKESAQ
jgi:hypothetical protein